MGEKELKNEFLPKRIQKEKNFVSVCRKEENVLDSRGRRIGRRIHHHEQQSTAKSLSKMKVIIWAT